MVVTKPADFRMNQKEYFKKAYEGEPICISRPRNENVVMISMDEYNRLIILKRLSAYYERIAELEKKSFDMDKKDKFSKEELKSFFDAFVSLAKKKKELLFSSLTSNIPCATDEETKEIFDELDSLSKDDLSIAFTETISV